jgi:hypothetical protein
MLVAIVQDDGETDLALLCVVCKQPFRSLTEAYIGHFKPTQGPPLHTEWVHKPCTDGNVERIFGGSEIRLQRGDWAMRTMLSRMRQHERYKMY